MMASQMVASMVASMAVELGRLMLASLVYVLEPSKVAMLADLTVVWMVS